MWKTYLSKGIIEQVQQATVKRISNHRKYNFPESVIIYEQNLLDEQTLWNLYKTYYDPSLNRLDKSYMHENHIDLLKDVEELVPLRYNALTDKLEVGVVAENDNSLTFQKYKGDVSLDVKHITLYEFTKLREKYYGDVKDLRDIAIKDVMDFLFADAISKGAADITICSKPNRVEIFYNIKKKKVYSKNVISISQIPEVISYITMRAKQSYILDDRLPKYFSIDLDSKHRGRVVLVNNFHGHSITIRILPNAIFNTSLQALNLSPQCIDFIRKEFINTEYGLKLLIGPTFSGKNTTIMAALREKILQEDCKAVSVEQPVEIISDFLDQIDCKTEEEYVEVTRSLIRQNPDLIYVVEMTDRTSAEVIKLANTGKEVYSTIHANSIADSIYRIQDMTGLPIKRIILNLHSCIFQTLSNIDGELRPKDTFYKFTQEDKLKMMNMEQQEIIAYITERQVS